MTDTPEGRTTRSFAAGRAAFLVSCPTDELAGTVEALFVDLPPAPDNAEPAVINLDPQDDGRLALISDVVSSSAPQSPDAALASLVTSINRLSLDSDPDRLHVHCATLAKNGRGVLVAASSGTGKTVLAGALALAGWTYVSDEAAALERDGLEAAGFAKPLLVKAGGGHVLPDLEAGRVYVDPASPKWLVPVSRLGAAIAASVDPIALVLLHNGPDDAVDPSPTTTPMHPNDLTVALMGHTMDAPRFGPDAVTTLARLAARCHCARMPVGSPAASVAALERLVAAPPPDVLPVDQIEAVAGASDRWRVRPTTRTITVGDRVVVHDAASGALAALDQAGSAAWMALAGHPPRWWTPDLFSSPETTGFLSQLAAHGFASPTAVDTPTGSS